MIPSLRIALVGLLVVCLGSAAQADLRDRARRMFDRITGVAPSETQLDQMVTLLGPGPAPTPQQLLDAAQVALDDPAFYNVSLVNFVAPWTNVDESVHVDLNDYTLTVIGMIRDDLSFDQILTADLIYVAAPGQVSTPYEHTSNAHYEEIQAAGLDYSVAGPAAQVIGVPQSTLPGAQVGPGEASGVLTTRAAAEAFFSAGTNRRMFRFTSMNFLCRDLEALKDTGRPADRIRQDVNRSPGGDSEIFHTQCLGCHAGMDALAGAFAYYNWDSTAGRMTYQPGQVQGKYAINTGVFPGGYETVDDSWLNLWRAGQNGALGWSDVEPGYGLGAKGFGAEVAHSRAFAECQVEKVFRHVCFRPAQVQDDADAITAIADEFEAGSTYDLKRVFARVAAHCTEGE